MIDPRTTDRDVSRAIQSWLHEDRHEDASRVAGAVLDLVEANPQRRATWWRARRMPDMNKLIPVGLGAAAVVVAVVVGTLVLASPTPGDVGGAPSVQPSPTPSPAPIPEDGIMRPGTYITRGFQAPDDGLTLRFTVPAGWHGFGDGTIFPDGADGTALQFTGVTALNSDLCHWADPQGEVNVGTTVDDLVAALVAQTKYAVSDPVDVSIGGYSGKRVDVVFPAKLFKETGSPEAPGCDEERTHLFGDEGIYGQGPNERWQNNILDVDGTRFLIIVQDHPDTTDADRAGTAAIVDSMVIEP